MMMPPVRLAIENPTFQAADRRPKTDARARGGRTSAMKVESMGQAMLMLVWRATQASTAIG
jgi:hypothetical protein